MTRFGVKEVADVTFFNLVTGEPELYLDTLKMSNLENNAESVYATGGKGGSRLVGWDFGRTSTFTIQDALLNPKALAMQLGTDLEEKVETIDAREVVVATKTATNTYVFQLSEQIKVVGSGVAKPFIYITDETGKAQLAKVDVTTVAPTYGTATVGTYTVSEITIMDTEINTALTDAGLTTGATEIQLLVYYKFDTIDKAEVITVASDKYAGFYKVVGDTVWRNEATGQDEKVQLVVPKAKITSNFNLTMQPDGDPSVFDFNLDVFKDSNSTDMVKMIRYKSNYEA